MYAAANRGAFVFGLHGYAVERELRFGLRKRQVEPDVDSMTRLSEGHGAVHVLANIEIRGPFKPVPERKCIIALGIEEAI